jgi:hypothetical protein
MIFLVLAFLFTFAAMSVRLARKEKVHGTALLGVVSPQKDIDKKL